MSCHFRMSQLIHFLSTELHTAPCQLGRSCLSSSVCHIPCLGNEGKQTRDNAAQYQKYQLTWCCRGSGLKTNFLGAAVRES